MDTAALLMAMALASVNFGWQPSDDDASAYDYIVQVEPELIDALQRGETIPLESNVPPEVAPIRRVRVEIGRGDVSRTAIRHTANFAGQQSGWTPDRYTAAPATGDNPNRYSTSAPPTLLEQTGTSLSNAGNSVTNQVQSALQSSGQQLSNASGQAMTRPRMAPTPSVTSSRPSTIKCPHCCRTLPAKVK